MAKAIDLKIVYTGSPRDGLALGLQTVPLRDGCCPACCLCSVNRAASGQQQLA